MSTLHAAAL